MNAATIAALARINRHFYSRFAGAFDATRSRAWPGWDRAVTVASGLWPAATHSNEPLTILDVGCGNGRFGEYIRARVQGAIDYVGVDESREMLHRARQRIEGLPDVRFTAIRRDLATGGPPDLWGSRRFDCIAVFGVLHHIPGSEQRRRLLEALAGCLSGRGVLLVSFWQFGEQRRFQRRIIDWSEHNRQGLEVVDLEQLEPGDCLLVWGREGEGSSRRYCHFTSEARADLVVSSLQLTSLDKYRADGQGGELNLYYILRS